jgi:clan AA aspartic protease (TIGR02281 family)
MSITLLFTKSEMKFRLSLLNFISLMSVALLTFLPIQVVSQTTIKMEKKNGVYYIPCSVNGLGLQFVFDTGAGAVSISMSEAVFMLKNGYLKEEDLIGTEKYRIANGDIAEGTKINIRELKIGDRVLYNVEGSIVHSISAPILLGQSALEKLGKFSIDYSNSIMTFSGNANSNNSNSQPLQVKIGDQIWMTKNLDVSVFRNGDPIPQAITDAEWEAAGKKHQPAWCYYNNDPANGAKYGKLYNWYAVNDPRGLAPVGYHIPTDNEWTILIDFLGGKGLADGKMKSPGTQYWQSPNSDATNESGFSGLPGGGRENGGEFYSGDKYGCWWSSTEYSTSFYAWGRDLHYNGDVVGRYALYKEAGFSVRCLRN